MRDLSGISQQKSLWLLTTSLVVIASAHYVLRGLEKSRERQKRYPPLAPAGIGEIIEQSSGSNYPWFILRMAKAVKSYTFRLNLPMLGTPMIVVVGNYGTQRMILTHRLTQRPLQFYNAFNNVTGGVASMFTSNGDYWHKRRKLIAPAFDKNHVKRMNDVAMSKTEAWIETKLRPMVEKGISFDVGQEMSSVMLSSLCETAFQYNLTESDRRNYLTDLDRCLNEFLFKSTTNPLRPLFGLLLSERREAHQAASRLMGFASTIIDHYRKLETPVKGTFIDRIVTSDSYESDRERQAEIVFLLLAGHDTTGFSIAWTLLELARNPEHIQDIRRSLVSMSPSEWEHSEPLRNVIRESMRLHPAAAAGSIRIIGEDTETVDGYLLPSGSIVFLSLILLLRNPNVYERPDEFAPKRWKDPSREMVDSFLPFSLGKQNCVGQALAKINLHSVVARMCSEFDLSVETECSVEFFLTLKPIGAKLFARKAACE